MPVDNNYGKFPQTPKTYTAVVTTAGTVTDDNPTNTVELMTAGADGTRVSKITAVPRATVTANALYLFVSKDNGTTKSLIDSALMKAHTVAATTAIPVTDFENISLNTPIELEAGDKLYVSCGVTLAGGIVITAQATDY